MNAKTIIQRTPVIELTLTLTPHEARVLKDILYGGWDNCWGQATIDLRDDLAGELKDAIEQAEED